MSRQPKISRAYTPTDDEDAMVKGRWYLFTAPGGFTLIAQYVRPLGMDRHRFRHATHLLNAGGLMLSQLCETGPGANTKVVPVFPGYWNGTPIWWTDYFGSTPWVRDE